MSAPDGRVLVGIGQPEADDVHQQDPEHCNTADRIEHPDAIDALHRHG